MDELITILEERKQAITSILSKNTQKHKSEFLQEQRKRCERQNWILRVLKNLKQPSIEQKKVIYQTILQLMNNYHSIQPITESLHNINYIETIINLFVQFYNRFDGMDLAHIKTIIRPNNNYIIVDLIKSLVDMNRKQFKNKIQEEFKDLPFIFHKRSQQKITHKLELSFHKTQEKEKHPHEEFNKKQKISISKKIECVLFEKYNKIIDNFNLEASHERFNQIYFDLLYLNNKNANKIQRYLDSCFGPKRHINYDVSGLYTQQQIKSLKRQKNQREVSLISQIKDLKQNGSEQHLKQSFKIKVQLHLSMNSFPSFEKQYPIRNWLPIICIKTDDKLHPYNIFIQYGGNYYTQPQFQQKFSKKMRVYLKEKLNEAFQKKKPLRSDDPDMANFDRKSFLDFNNSKVTDLIIKQVYNFKKDKQSENKLKQKQKFLLPLIKNIQQTEPQSLNRNFKAKSLQKFPNTSVILSSNKLDKSSGQVFQKRLNYSSFVKNISQSRKKINTLIDNALKSKQYIKK